MHLEVLSTRANATELKHPNERWQQRSFGFRVRYRGSEFRVPGSGFFQLGTLNRWIRLLAVFFGLLATGAWAAVPPANLVKLVTQHGYLPNLPVLVRVEVLTPQGARDWSLWDGEALLSVNSGAVTLSTNRVPMRNGLGSALVAFSGGGDFDLTATVGALQATRPLVSLAGAPVTTVGGTSAGDAVWGGVVRVTNDFTLPAGFTLTILSNTLVLLDGVSSGTAGVDLNVNGRIDVQGTESDPVTLTCSSTNLNVRWGQLRHSSASLATAPVSTYRWAAITRAGRAPGEGHTLQAPVVRSSTARLRFEHCSITDHAVTTVSATDFGTPGKIGYATGSELNFDDCLFQRARMGPEIEGTAVLFTNGVIMDMRGTDDSDGMYIHAQSGGQVCALKRSVIAAGDDDGLDTLDPVVTVEDCILRDWASVVEDAKAISVFNGVTTVRRCLIVDSTVGISAKTANSSTSVRVNIHESTITRNRTNVLAQFKSNATGPRIDYRITNSILWGVSESVASDFGETNFTIGFCNISEPWTGTGNIFSDPLFADAANHDFRLLPFSPSIDAGNPLSPADPDGSPIDLGWSTFLPAPSVLSHSQKMPDGSVGFDLSGYTNRQYVIEFSTNALDWLYLLSSFQTNDPSLMVDPAARNSPMRLYRARLAP
ncbi:MAG TPA: hypothetical protein VFT34_14990 [Verrucomicrobiae bacterium]|nr:hypothetical protein [Verrucomicrobiae bacterium]